MLEAAVVFPGQGSQSLGMGRDLADNNDEVMSLWKKAEKISGLPLRGIYWDGDEEAMIDTRNLQPALTVVNVAYWLLLSPKVSPLGTAGHSLGEYSALAIAEVLSLKEIFETVTLRGELMATADPDKNTAMGAVLKLSLPDVLKIAEEASRKSGELLVVANRNTPGQFILSGTKKAMHEAGDLVKEVKGRLIPLAVSAAFHSPLMAEASLEFNKFLSKLDWCSPKFPVYSNVSGQAVSDRFLLAEIMQKQMISPVLWIDTINNMFEDNVQTWLELGAKSILGKMISAILEDKAKTEGQVLDSNVNIQSVNTYKQARDFLEAV